MTKAYLVCTKTVVKWGLYQYEIITKPCLINENMTLVSELIHQNEHAIVSDCSVAKDEGDVMH